MYQNIAVQSMDGFFWTSPKPGRSGTGRAGTRTGTGSTFLKWDGIIGEQDWDSMNGMGSMTGRDQQKPDQKPFQQPERAQNRDGTRTGAGSTFLKRDGIIGERVLGFNERDGINDGTGLPFKSVHAYFACKVKAFICPSDLDHPRVEPASARVHPADVAV